MINTKLQTLLEETGAILNGHFLLTSGRHSNRYIEKFRVLERPDVLDEICQEMAAPYKGKNIQIVLGAAIGGILIAGGVGIVNVSRGILYAGNGRLDAIVESAQNYTNKIKEIL